MQVVEGCVAGGRGGEEVVYVSGRVFYKSVQEQHFQNCCRGLI